jgi:TonB family protein
MTLHLFLMDLVNYSVQIGALIAIGSLAPRLLRLRRPDILLHYRHLLLAACLLLPFAQSWKHPLFESDEVSMTTGALTRAVPAGRFWSPHFSFEETAAFLLCLGILARLGWLAIGLRRLRRYRRRAQIPDSLPPVLEAVMARLGVKAAIFLSSDISSPVTFGLRDPAILLPPDFLSVSPGVQQAIACHELTHVRRRDWAAAMIEELIRAVFWFHPAIWWLLGEIRLAREQTVDRQVLRMTAAREQYVSALLAAAGHWQPDLAPAPSFLRMTHLAQRVDLMMKEISMSKRRLFSSLAAICGALVLTARFAIVLFPISAPAQEVVKGDANLLHRAPVVYPADALQKGIHGTVVVEATLNDHGVVTDARVISGPDPLRRAALRSVLEWHYAAGTASPVEIAIDFKPSDSQRAAATAISAPVQPGVVKNIRYVGLTQQVREAVASVLPVHEGDTWSADALDQARQAVHGIDEHLNVAHQRLTSSQSPAEYALQISYAAASAPQRIRVGGNVQATQVISNPKPVYPPEAKLARIQGVVRMNVIISKDGTVQDVQVDSGDPALTEVAAEAVRQWVYKPTLLNGQPVEVATVVDVNFTLRQ